MSGTIVIRKDIREEDYKDVVESSIEKVTKKTKHPA